MTAEALSRRSLLRGFAVAAVAGVAGYVLARNSSAARAKGASTAANGYGAAPKAGGKPLVPLDKVPVSGGLILTGPRVVLTRGPGDAVHAFSAVCTHQGCTVNSVAKNVILCPCHGSRFNAQTGAVISGPASRPLPPIAITVRGGQIFTS